MSDTEAGTFSAAEVIGELDGGLSAEQARELFLQRANAGLDRALEEMTTHIREQVGTPDPLIEEAKEQVQKLLTKAHEAAENSETDRVKLFLDVADRWLLLLT